ncbi:MAG: helix-turn-helix transcriptional regulator [Gammaproteobacteria bacterium]|uniref:helix-turn-helix domain-containing protein n=1 Tax=Rhodoferax sp. TaxID=50421 RepID=UPI00179D77E1|nr:helix-turn-helix transcriptional regulator [Rhodoferax sp.]MBU3900862.1 helix-turn-helix transcriptional regulator [Gammaproteobacteria bacterium]MBA3058652.1 helix-turn-helix transcriptional regulator [Rhodoferax sp.]MBU3998365.1 helix-turn-helix transcriptional regulator [Gammaproteobacteria bacterium]MBU4082216.1 helix-turn-helix transcriptional regulator [Gammaproteobacteria bacterium]MBU4112766.1 helix-turn-helix transcriptional regulator [Gammaproteobacteria bacterium]
MSETELFGNIVRELAEPLILIDESRSVVYASHAFDQLVGPHRHACRCETFLLPTASMGDFEFCCWDVLDHYSAQNGQAFWPLITSDDRIIPTLCRISTIELAARPLYIVLRFSLLADAASPVALDFFRAQHRTLGSRAVYGAWLKHYLHQHYQPQFIAWVGVESDWPGYQTEREQAIQMVYARGLSMETPTPFDLLLRQEGESFLYHVFPCAREGGESEALVMSAPRNGFTAPMVDEIRQAVNLTTAPPWNGAENQMSTVVTNFGFTDKERRILLLLTKGASDKEIAETLNFSVHTIKNQVRSMMEKAQVHKRTVLVALATT